MKKIAISLCLSVVVYLTACKKECTAPDPVTIHDTLSVHDTVGCKYNLSSGLLAYYPFNGNFNDESGNGNTATAMNGAFLTTDFLGRTNKCAGFDGVNDFLLVPGSSKLNSDSFTVSFQVMVNNSNRRNATISRINYQTGHSLTFAIHESQPTDNKWDYFLAPGTDDCSKDYPYDPTLAMYSKGPILAGRWYNITATFGNGVQRIYVDGVLESTKTQTFANAKKCANADLLIGGWWSADVVSIDGKIDEVRLYNRVLTDCEIGKLADSWK